MEAVSLVTQKKTYDWCKSQFFMCMMGCAMIVINTLSTHPFLAIRGLFTSVLSQLEDSLLWCPLVLQH